MYQNLARTVFGLLVALAIGTFPLHASGQDINADFSPFGSSSSSSSASSGMKKPADWHENDWVKFIDSAASIGLGEAFAKVGGRFPLVDVYSALSGVSGATRTGLIVWLKNKMDDANDSNDLVRLERYQAFYTSITTGDTSRLRALEQPTGGAMRNTNTGSRQRTSQYTAQQIHLMKQWVAYYDNLLNQWTQYRDRQVAPYYNHPTYYQWARNEYARSNQAINTLNQYKAYYQNLLRQSGVPA